MSSTMYFIKLSRLLVHLTILFTLFSTITAKVYVFSDNENIEEFNNNELSFARPLPQEGIMGAVISANPPDACANISAPPFQSEDNWFVLIAGNKCDYDRKVLNAEKAGYALAIIYNLRGRDDGPYRDRKANVSNISAITVRTSVGLIIKENYLFTIDDRFEVLVYRNTPFNVLTFLLLFAIIAGMFIVIMLSFVILRYVQQTQMMEHSRLSKNNLKKLQTTKYKIGDPYETCAICLEDYKVKDQLRILPCQHGYHAKCIDPWLTESRRICPVCKQKVVFPNEFAEANPEPDGQSERTPLLIDADQSSHGSMLSSQNATLSLPNMSGTRGPLLGPNDPNVLSKGLLGGLVLGSEYTGLPDSGNGVSGAEGAGVSTLDSNDKGTVRNVLLGSANSYFISKSGTLYGTNGAVAGTSGSVLGATGSVLGATGSVLGADGSVLVAGGILVNDESNTLMDSFCSASSDSTHIVYADVHDSG